MGRIRRQHVLFLVSCISLLVLFLWTISLNEKSIRHPLQTLWTGSGPLIPYINLSSGRDILAFVHVQKTGGSSFLAHLTTVRRKDGVRLCREPSVELRDALKRRKFFMVCPLDGGRHEDADTTLPEMWLASERTYGWWCGVHPFLYEIHECLGDKLIHKYGVKDRSFHFITILRHPILRYISEYLHVTRGATWSRKSHICNGQSMEAFMPPCYAGYYSGEPWTNVTLDKFMKCSSNWANNRQTMMLANISLVHCLDNDKTSQASRDQLLLDTAKANLNRMAFFGLSDYFVESCKLFENQFQVEFSERCRQKNINKLHSSALLHDIWTNRALYHSIITSNYLDIQLYEYALQLFTSRLNQFNIYIDHRKVDKEILNQ